MSEYATKRELTRLFKCSDRTVQRWIDEGRPICFDGKEYRPEKTPGGQWRFVVVKK
jgi:phage terminase Nu1 subunit (DNA packaging protein)